MSTRRSNHLRNCSPFPAPAMARGRGRGGRGGRGRGRGGIVLYFEEDNLCAPTLPPVGGPPPEEGVAPPPPPPLVMAEVMTRQTELLETIAENMLHRQGG